MREKKEVSIGVWVGGESLTRRILSIVDEDGWSPVEVKEEMAGQGPRSLEEFDVLLVRGEMALSFPSQERLSLFSEEDTAVVVLLDGEKDPNFEKAVRWGANAVVDRDDPQENIVHAVEEALSGAIWISPVLARRWLEILQPSVGEELGLPDPIFGERLTTRESEILMLVLEGLSNSQIAEKAFLSLGAVKYHVSNILRKFGCQRRSQLIAYCRGQSLKAR